MKRRIARISIMVMLLCMVNNAKAEMSNIVILSEYYRVWGDYSTGHGYSDSYEIYSDSPLYHSLGFEDDSISLGGFSNADELSVNTFSFINAWETTGSITHNASMSLTFRPEYSGDIIINFSWSRDYLSAPYYGVDFYDLTSGIKLIDYINHWSFEAFNFFVDPTHEYNLYLSVGTQTAGYFDGLAGDVSADIYGPVPEPATLLLLGLGAVVLRRKTQLGSLAK